MQKEKFKQWWGENGSRGISYCECNYKADDVTLEDIRKWVQEFKGVTNPIGRKKPKKKCKIVQLTDFHIPHHDKKSLNAVYKFLSDFKPDKIILTGDILDFYQLSKFDKDPTRRFTIQDEIDQAYEVFKTLKKLCPEIHFIKGNHCDRLRRFLWVNPSLASIKVLELYKLLNLDTLGIEYHDYEYIYKGFRFTHGSIVRADSGASAKAELLKYGSNTSSGHTHRLGMFLKSDARGTVGAYEMGCLCELTPEYVDGVPNWQQGFGIFHFDDDRFFCQQIPIIKNEFIYGNKRYKGD